MTSIVVEKQAYKGVKKIAEKFAGDFEMVYGVQPQLQSELLDTNGVLFIFLTIGKSDLYEALKEKASITIEGKHECYQIIIDDNKIYIVGSDKRGSIYGIFDLSEQIGVTPFVFWGDTKPQRRENFNLEHITEKTSKEPSVEYRGFFINDEWPCFGNWTKEHFGGFNAHMYDKVLEFLLRLKGNCLWPAMWSSSFALDGPGSLNEELADIYGVVINYSHHEPCLRASEEWDIYKGEEYGLEWNYSTNKDGLHSYWRDGLIRSGKYENIITMGMRGERDSRMQGVHTLEECIDAWKEIITNQDKLINDFVQDPEKHPKLIAIYKEVEDYFFGDEKTPGLKNWKGLEDKILMFCEDNFGYMRRLPQDQLTKHAGGLGMYYHLDYHGDPVSYEWINSTSLYKIWEQMSLAYQHGIQKIWMVNVGDLKGNEFPLSYFMALAYDFEKWGASNENSYLEYPKLFANTAFNNEKIADLIIEGTELIAKRKPEALSIDTYSLTHGEVDSLIEKCKGLIEELGQVKTELSDVALDGYFSMVQYPLEIGLNHILLHLYGKKNQHYAMQGKHVANRYGQLLADCYKREKELKEDFSNFKDGKWKGMELAAHTGFTKWNEDGAKKPLRYTVEPLEKAALLVSKIDDTTVFCKNYGSYERIVIEDYMYMGKQLACVEVANAGLLSLKCKVKCQSPYYQFSWTEKEIFDQELLLISYDCKNIQKLPEKTEAFITDGDTTVVLELRRPVDYIIIDPLVETENRNQSFIPLPGFGKHKNAIKLLEKSVAEYNFWIANLQKAKLEICLAPNNPIDEGNQLAFIAELNGQENRIQIFTDDYKAGDAGCKQWAMGVLDNERRIVLNVKLKAGENNLTLKGITDGVIVEKIMLHGDHIGSTYTGI